jgi:WD40 repeat protein
LEREWKTETIVRLWDAESGKALHEIGKYEQFVTSVVFSPDGKKIGLTDENETIRLLEIDSAKELKKFETPPSMVGGTFSSDWTKILKTMNDGIQIMDIESEKIQSLRVPNRSLSSVYYTNHNIISTAFSPDGKKIGLAGDYGLAGIWVWE